MHTLPLIAQLEKQTPLVLLLLLMCIGNANALVTDPLECARLDTFDVLSVETEQDISAFLELYNSKQNSPIYPSIEILEKAITNAKELDLRKEYAELSHYLLVAYFHAKSDLEKQISTAMILENNLELIKEHRKSQALNLLGKISSAAGDNSSALSYYQRAYDAADSTNLDDKLYPLGNLATTFLANQDTVDAIELIHKSIRLTDQLTNEEEIAYNNVYDYASLGNIHLAQGKIDSAWTYLNLATSASKFFIVGHRRYEETQVTILPSLIHLNLTEGNFKESNALIDSLNIFWPELALLLRAEYHESKGELNKALALTDTPIETDLTLDYQRVVLRRKLASKLNSFKIFDEASTELLSIVEENLATTKKELVTISKAQLLASEKQREIEAQRYENQLELLRTRQRNWIALVLILLSSAIAIWFNKRYQESKKKSQSLSKIVTRHERDLIVANKQLASKVKSMERFNHLLSHDLREPLRSISGFTSILSRKAKPYPDLKEDLDILKSSVNQLSNLMTGVEVLRKTEERDYTPLKIKLRDLIQEVSHDVKKKYRDHDINIIPAGDSISVELDPFFLTASLLELVDNAAKFSKDKTAYIAIEITLHEDELTIFVQDEGIGMEQQFSEQIFGIFKRLNRREFFTGSGVGLALAKLAAEKSGGSLVLLESKLGKGSTFKLTFPLASKRASLHLNVPESLLA